MTKAKLSFVKSVRVERRGCVEYLDKNFNIASATTSKELLTKFGEE